MEEITLNENEIKDASCCHISEMKSQLMKSYKLLYSFYVLGFDEKNNKIDWERRAEDCVCCDCDIFASKGEVDRCELLKQSKFQVHACLSCIYFGCFMNELSGEYSFGCHIKLHSEAMQHPLAMNVSGGQVMCFECDNYMYDRDLIHIAEEQKLKAKELIHPDTSIIGTHEKFEPTPELVAILRKHTIVKSASDVTGLINTARKTCYLNVIVQSLLSAPILREYLLSYEHKCPIKTKEKICLICKFMNVAQKVLSGRKNAIALYDLLYAIFERIPNINSTHFQDACDILTDLLKEFHKDETGKAASHRDTERCECLVHRIFQFHLKKKRCNNVDCEFSKGYDYFEWTFFFMKEMDKCITDGLRRTFQEMEFHCDTCNDYSGCADQHGLVNPPYIMYFSIELDLMDKSGQYFKFDATLDLSPFIVQNWKSEIDSRLEYMYYLFAVVEFLGKVYGSGHYVCYIRKPEGWFKCNDNKIEEISIEEVLKVKSARLIFYHKAFL